MTLQRLTVLLLAALPAMTCSPWRGAAAATYAARQGPTELRYWDRTRAFAGYTLFGAKGKTYLIDMEGRVVHTWNVGTNPRFLDNGHLLDAATDDPSGFAGFKELDWDGNVVWQHTEKRTGYSPHHDFVRIFNKKLGAYTTMYIANKTITHAEALAAGADPAKGPYEGAQLDAVVEVDMSGTVVWEWWFFDHAVQDVDAAKANHVGSGKSISDYPGRIDINLPGQPLRKDWLHCNSMDYNAELDQVLINSVQGELYVIDHGGTFVAGNPTASIALAAGPAGDFLYRFGDPARYGQGNPPSVLEDWTAATTGHKQIGGSHDAHWIRPGLPGAGHILVYNNGQYLFQRTSQSYAVEVDPFRNAAGVEEAGYVNPPAAGYRVETYPTATQKMDRLISNQVVWSWGSASSLTDFSQIGSSASRLANGNTLICSDTEGHLVEVTAGGEVVWEYVNPVASTGIVLQVGDNAPMTNALFRAYRYASDHPALAGRTLTAGATIAGRTTVENPYADAASYRALQAPTELRYLDSARAFAGYTLFAAGGRTYLIDLEGRVVKTWPVGTNPRLLPGGALLDAAAGTPSAFTTLQELDWNGAVTWQHRETRTGYTPHHDFLRITNTKLNAPTTLYLARRSVTHEQAIAAGCDPADGPYGGAEVDAVVEVDARGTVVWEWWFFDHLIQDVDAAKANHVGAGKKVSDHPGRINANIPGQPMRADWLRCNSLDYNPALDQIVITSGYGEIYVIDHGGTFVAGNPTASIALAAGPAGDFLYRFGDPARYGQGNPPSVAENWNSSTTGHKQIGGAHAAHWIAAGLPGAGNLLVFNNGQLLFERTPQSYVFEVGPFLNSSKVDTGSYVNPPAAGYTTWVDANSRDTHKQAKQLSNQVIWKYFSISNTTLFSPDWGSAQRLANGNTLICSGADGTFFEITSSGDVVWEYVNPVTAGGVATVLGDRLPMTNPVFRARRYAATDAAFTGRDLTPGPVITKLTTVAPAAAFTFSPAAPTPGETVSFSDASTGGPTSWAWEFGDGGTSSEQRPSHAYVAAGGYVVTLTVTNASGTDRASRTVTVGGGAAGGEALIVPTVAHLRGLSSSFTSRIEAYNAGTAAMRVAVRYTPRSDVGGAVRTAAFDLEAGRMATVEDPLGTWFGVATGEKAVGSLTLTVTSGTAADLLVTSVVTARNDDGSEYGQDLAGVREADALQTGERAYLASLVDATRTRINLAVIGLDDGTVVSVQPVDPIGVALAVPRTLTLGAGVSSQLDDLNNGAAGFGLGSRADYLLQVDVVSGRAIVYASILDGTSRVPGTSDPTTIRSVERGATSVTLLQLGAVQGLNEFAGSAQISNLSSSMADVAAEFHARGVPGVAATATFSIPAGGTVGYADLVGDLFHAVGVGAVVLRATNGTKITATGREFAVYRDGAGAVTGTAGQLISGMTAADLLQPGVTYHLLGLRQRPVGSSIERSHVTAFNPGSMDAQVTVKVYDGASGGYEGSTTVVVRAGELVQVNNIIAAVNAAQDGATKRLEVTVDQPLHLTASRVNATGDPITIDALAP